MKKLLCLALSGMLLAGSVPAYGAEEEKKETSHIFTAKVGTTEFCKDGVLQSLDVPIYLKDGYVMLPLRTFLTSVGERQMHWNAETKLAWIQLGGNIVAVHAEKNQIAVDGEPLSMVGRMEVKEGRIFVPLRNWKQLLCACGYEVTDADIRWDAKEKLATVEIREKKEPEQESIVTGEGADAEFSLPLSREYDEIEALGEGYFIAKKYEESLAGLGSESSSRSYDLIDATGKVLLHYDDPTIRQLKDIGNGFLELSYEDGKDSQIIDRKGKVQFTLAEDISIHSFSEGLARVWLGGKEGYVDETGSFVIPLQYELTNDFSEGLAAVRLEGNWGYIDKTGNFVVPPRYITANEFSEGLAAVKTEEGWGYLDKEGAMVIPPRYAWVGPFTDGKAFVTEAEGQRTWVIDTTGEKLKKITEGRKVCIFFDYPKGDMVFRPPFDDWGRGDDTTGSRYFDYQGEITEVEATRRRNMAEGLFRRFDLPTRAYYYFDTEGKQAISVGFDKAEPFRDGYAVVANEVTLENGMVDVEWGILRHPEK